MLLGNLILIRLFANPLFCVEALLPIRVTLVKSSNSGNTSGDKFLK